MTDAQQREAARQFYYRWNGKGQEDQDARSYWIELLSDILGVENVTQRLDFEKRVFGSDGNVKKIDVYIPETHVLIEQKSLGIALDKPQISHSGMTPYEQAKMYDNGLISSEKARWIVTSNFAEIWIYDMEQSKPAPVKIDLDELQSKYHMLSFLTHKETKKITDEMKLSLDAGRLVGEIYDAFLKQYRDPEDPKTLQSLNKLCVRIVFCLYGEDSGIFGRKNMFHDYMVQFDASHARVGLRNLFRVLDQKPEERDPYLSDDDPQLAAFPYVNGGLFADENIEIPPITDEILNLILRNASDSFDWSEISPTIFGAVFESTLNPETRRSGGMHYTSIENIHKVIDPLFLDDLKEEYESVRFIDVLRTKRSKLEAFQKKLASLKFLDPAAGSGNFLTETYLSLRKLENNVIADLFNMRKQTVEGQIGLGAENINWIQVSISQFYGIEINDFAVTVAKTALWIAENQMMRETESIISMNIDFLPLKTNAHIVEGNALRIDWNDVVPKEELSYIMGNPPFVGARLMSPDQKSDVFDTFGSKWKNAGNLDYVSCWYKKATDLTKNTNIRCALVSTNSVCQGETVANLWKPLFENGVHLDFAHRTFRWDSEASIKAHVHCVIVGFSNGVNLKPRIIYSNDSHKQVSNINGYLLDADNVFIQSRVNPICDVPSMMFGSMANDNGYLSKFTDEDKRSICTQYPAAQQCFKQFLGAEEFINNKLRWCLWLKNVSPAVIKAIPPVVEAIQNVKAVREKSSRSGTRKMAEYPALFGEIRQPDSPYLLVPRVSSERRRYVPIGFMSPDVISSDATQIIPDATLYHFGILTSNVHMAWMRAVCGRLKSDYRYSKDIVYNNFPWPMPTEAQKAKIEQTAQGILNARVLYPEASLADLYDELTMPSELRKAHQANDRAVMEAYGMPIKETDEAACVAWLMRLYQEKVKELNMSEQDSAKRSTK